MLATLVNKAIVTFFVSILFTLAFQIAHILHSRGLTNTSSGPGHTEMCCQSLQEVTYIVFDRYIHICIFPLTMVTHLFG